MNSNIFDIIKLQREFFSTRKTYDLSFRRHLLQNLRLMLDENEADILAALNADLGKSSCEAYMTEIGMVHREINLALRNLSLWTSPKIVPTPIYLAPGKSKKYPHPLGVTMIFSPWNYPVNLSLIPLVSSIAAGNCTILKLSEHSKNTTADISELTERK